MAFIFALFVSGVLSLNCIDRENDPAGINYDGDVNFYNHPQHGYQVELLVKTLILG